MDHNRIFGDGFSLVQPRSTGTMLMPGAFVVCPWPLQAGVRLSGVGMVDIYRLAHEQARVALQPPWHERNLLASFN
jgi:hypothetical protein